MKQLMSIFVICIAAMTFFSQWNTISAAGVPQVRRVQSVKEADPMPTFPGGIEAFSKIINDSIAAANTRPGERQSFEGKKIEIRLIVMKDGSVGPYTIFLTEAPRLKTDYIPAALKNLKFTPGEVNGQPVNVDMTIPVIIHFPEEKTLEE